MFKKIHNYFNTESGRREVQIQSVTGNLQIITADFDESAEDWDSLTEKQLIDKAIDWQYRTFMQGKFLNEAVDLAEKKAREAEQLAKQIKESADLIDSLNNAKVELEAKVSEINKAIEESKASTEKNNELIKTVSLTMNELISMLAGDEDEPTEEDAAV